MNQLTSKQLKTFHRFQNVKNKAGIDSRWHSFCLNCFKPVLEDSLKDYVEGLSTQLLHCPFCGSHKLKTRENKSRVYSRWYYDYS